MLLVLAKCMDVALRYLVLCLNSIVILLVFYRWSLALLFRLDFFTSFFHSILNTRWLLLIHVDVVMHLHQLLFQFFQLNHLLSYLLPLLLQLHLLFFNFTLLIHFILMSLQIFHLLSDHLFFLNYILLGSMKNVPFNINFVDLICDVSGACCSIRFNSGLESVGWLLKVVNLSWTFLLVLIFTGLFFFLFIFHIDNTPRQFIIGSSCIF